MLYVVGGILALWILAAVAGIGKNTVFRNPHSMSDAAIERTIRLSEHIMNNSKIGSKAWSESGAKYTAALNEQLRRAGQPSVRSYDQAEYEEVERQQRLARGDYDD